MAFTFVFGGAMDICAGLGIAHDHEGHLHQHGEDDAFGFYSPN